MNTYLRGYLASIPKSEYDNLINFLRNNIAERLNISKEQFELIMSQIITDKQPATQSRTTLYDEKPSDTYDDFYSKVYIDLSYLFKVINLLYNAVEGYANLSASHLSDIKGEIDKLYVMVKELKAREEYGNNSVVITETFKNTQNFEDYNDSTAYLFCDRDGSALDMVDLNHNNTDDMITLRTTDKKDLLHGPDGKPYGKLDVIDFRGVPCDTYATTYNAIDNSKLSYWDCSVYSDEPISTPMENFEGGGAYIKYKVRLPKICDITEVSITPYCIHPVEICDVKIGDISILAHTESSADTITFRTVKIPSDEITITMRQKNYTYSVVSDNEKLTEADELWNSLFGRKKDSYTSDARPVKDKKDVYLKYLDGKEDEMETWNKDYIKNKEMGE